MIWNTSQLFFFSLFEPSTEQIVTYDDSWIKITSKENCVSRIVLTIKLFFCIFYKKIFMFLIIMIHYHSQLNKLIVFYYHKASDILLSVIPYWICVTRKNICLSLLGGCSCSSNTWRSRNMAPLSLSLVLKG